MILFENVISEQQLLKFNKFMFCSCKFILFMVSFVSLVDIVFEYKNTIIYILFFLLQVDIHAISMNITYLNPK